MNPETFVDPHLPLADLVVLDNLLGDIEARTGSRDVSLQKGHHGHQGSDGYAASVTSIEATNGNASESRNGDANGNSSKHQNASRAQVDKAALAELEAMNDSRSADFEPTVFVSMDIKDINSKTANLILHPYIKLAQKMVRYPTDVVMATHLLLYFTTSLPSAILLYRNFTWVHGILHTIISFWYVGSYTLMRHQHIHQNGVLARKAPISWFDALFPYITDPFMGHTWNSYYYHHVKHHHVEGNGPDDLSSTIRYQRDSLPDFLHYIGRFYFLIWFDLPIYFLQKKKYTLAFKGSFWETANYAFFILMARANLRPTLFVYIFPFLLLRLGLMIGNWGQHAFVDDEDPDSDYRSSITLIDVPSNRYCFNDGYHTSHHLNPLRHWRQHPVHFLKEKKRYADEQALVFRNIDYLMISVRLMMKDYAHLARCLVPMGKQIDMSMEEREELLKRKTRRFTEEEIQAKFGKK
ncbi:hypothetical protein BLS_001085 [Venturia inaequalis]|uniref:Fatty acid desaturase domain-containing protein n=1 Tax=Venturia inaequalis TaxID=5025 RepID=A0A8H3YIQ4_VENIN|nr:hypothetical protein BLS_001085 [Venturia inaequalis]